MTSQRQRNNAAGWNARIAQRLRKAETPAATTHVWWDELRRVVTDPDDSVWGDVTAFLKERARKRGRGHAA